MDSSPNMIRCTIDFLPEEGEYDVIIAFRSKGEGGWHGCREQRFNNLGDACGWVEKTYPEVIDAAKSAKRQPEIAPINSKKPIIFVSTNTAPKQASISLKKILETKRNNKG